MFDKLKKAALIASPLSAFALMAEEITGSTTATLPNIGVDVGSYASTAITSLGAIVAVVVGGFVAFLLVRLALRWVKKIG